MNKEFKTLTYEQQNAVNRVVAQARGNGGLRTEDLPDNTEAYAYEGSHEKISWGVNGNQGFNVARGVLKPGETL
jgi:hypothetical protein